MVVISTICELQKWQTPFFGVALNFLITGGQKRGGGRPPPPAPPLPTGLHVTCYVKALLSMGKQGTKSFARDFLDTCDQEI